MAEGVSKVVLAYSGGLDTSIILKWLVETYQCDVVAFTAGIGQGEDLEQVKAKALQTGASVAYVEDLQEEFVLNYVFPILRANAAYEGWYLLGTSIARPLIAKHQIEVAQREGADAVSHGATGKGNDQVRFEVTYYTLKPDIKVIAPWREWDLGSRTALIAYGRQHDIPMPVTEDEPYSCDRNLLHSSYEGGILEDPWRPPAESMFATTVSPERAPDKPVEIEIGYEEGNPVAIDGKRETPARLLAHLNRIGGENGVGRVDMVENRFVGMKSRGVYETPGGTILHVAHRAIESITMDREVMHLRDSWVPKYAELVYNGFWFSPERQMLQTAIDKAQRDVTGTVRLKLYKGNCMVLGRKSEKSLYSPSHATFEADKVYRQGDADGFIKLQALRLRIHSLLRKQDLT